MTWNGTTWTTVTSPNVNASHNLLQSVSCTSSTSCVAVGYYYSGFADRTLVMTWDGTTWTTVTSPTTSNYSDDTLNSVSCTSSTSCNAVGDYASRTADQTLAMRIVPPIVLPSAPTSLVATLGNASVSIAFTPGAAGTDSITKYQYTTTNGVSWVDVTSGGTSSPITITTLSNYTNYSIKLRAFSTVGGTPSTAVSVTTKIAAPTIVTAYSVAQTGNASRGLYVAFTGVAAPGTTMVSYRINVYAKGTNTVVSTALLSPKVRHYFLGGLTKGVEYDIRVIGYLKLTGSPLVTRGTYESATRTIRV